MHRRGLLTPDFGIGLSKTDPASGDDASGFRCRLPPEGVGFQPKGGKRHLEPRSLNRINAGRVLDTLHSALRIPHLCIPPFSWNPTPSGDMHRRGLLTPDFDDGLYETDPQSGTMLAVSGAVYPLRAWASNRMGVNGAWNRGALPEYTQVAPWILSTLHSASLTCAYPRSVGTPRLQGVCTDEGC